MDVLGDAASGRFVLRSQWIDATLCLDAVHVVHVEESKETSTFQHGKHLGALEASGIAGFG